MLQKWIVRVISWILWVQINNHSTVEYFRTDFPASRLLSSEPISTIYSVLSQVSGNAEQLERNPQSSWHKELSQWNGDTLEIQLQNLAGDHRDRRTTSQCCNPHSPISWKVKITKISQKQEKERSGHSLQSIDLANILSSGLFQSNN